MSPPGSAPSWADTRRTGPTPGSAGSLLRILGTPFFPLVQSGLDGLGANLVDEVPNLELGLAKELAIGFGGQQLGDRADLVADGLHQDAFDPLGLVLLFGGEREAGHGVPPCVQLRRENRPTHQRSLLYEISHPLSRRLPRFILGDRSRLTGTEPSV